MRRAIAAVGFLGGALAATVLLESRMLYITGASSGVPGVADAGPPPVMAVEVIPAPLWAVVLVGLVVAGIAYRLLGIQQERARVRCGAASAGDAE